MSSSVNYDDLYEEFVRLTSSPKNLPGQDTSTQYITIKCERVDSPDGSPLRALTPPSPFSVSGPLPPPPAIPQQQQLFPVGFPPPYAETIHSHQFATNPPPASSVFPTNYSMCDTSEISTAPSMVVSSAANIGQGKHLNCESNLNSNHGNIQSFLPSLLPQPQGSSSMINGHTMALDNHSSQQLHQHPLPQIPPHQHHHSPYNNHMQHHFMENHHHHAQQMSIPQQHSAHLVPPPPSHLLPHPAHGQVPQQLIPFGIHLNTNNVGNGTMNSFGNPQLNPFHPHHHPQIPNQQPAHSMNPLQQHACFMQHAACMQMQHQQSLAALSTQRGVGWINGPPPSTSIANTSASTNNSCVSGLGTKPTTSSVSSSVIPDPTALPGGLDVLWREVPPECQRIMVPQDIPDTARFRGYFTVCELLALKRALMARLGCGDVPTSTSLLSAIMPKNASSNNKEEGRRGSKRGNSNNSKTDSSPISKIPATNANAEKFRNGKENLQQVESANDQIVGSSLEEHVCEIREDVDGNSELQDIADSPNGELMINLDNIKHEIHTTIPPAITGICVGGAVKEALEALSFDQNNGLNEDATTEPREERGQTLVINGIREATCHEVGSEVVVGHVESQDDDAKRNDEEMPAQKEDTIAVTFPLPSLPPLSGFFSEKQNDNSIVPEESVTNDNAEPMNESNYDDNHQDGSNCAPSIGSDYGTPSSLTSTVHINTSPAPGSCNVSVEGRFTGAPPPYRTATLVLKLLQIGAYHIRSFSSLNPNRLRVLFNTQRMTYECQLPIVRTETPTTSASAHPLRKVLTVDIGFDQVSMIKFGPDMLCMRIEGAPLLTVAYNPAQEESTTQVLTPHDQFLLDQIDKGQLKLSPCHQLYFLNERLVSLLESQFREHPRFRHLLTSNN